MSVTIECPCGHAVRVPDGMDHGRIKCTVCGELLSASDAQQDTPDSPAAEVAEVADQDEAAHTEASPPAPITDRTRPNVPAPVKSRRRAPTEAAPEPRPHISNVTQFQGLTGFRFAGLLWPSFFGEASLTLLPGRVRLKSKRLFDNRRADLLLSGITAGETRRVFSLSLFILGVLLLSANGVGLILLLAFVFVRHSFVVLTCGTTSAVVRFKGDDSDACAIVDAILQTASDEEERRTSGGGQSGEKP
jgi:hypothetical protein